MVDGRRKREGAEEGEAEEDDFDPALPPSSQRRAHRFSSILFNSQPLKSTLNASRDQAE